MPEPITLAQAANEGGEVDIAGTAYSIKPLVRARYRKVMAIERKIEALDTDEWSDDYDEKLVDLLGDQLNELLAGTGNGKQPQPKTTIKRAYASDKATLASIRRLVTEVTGAAADPR